MISLNKVSVFFGAQTLFDEVSFMINPGDRIGLVGKNGAGKSTLLKLICGEQSESEGSIFTAKDIKIGYLKQELDFNDGLTVLQETETAFSEIKSIETEIEPLKRQLEDRNDNESDDYLQLINQISELEERFVMLDGYSLQSNISKVLLGLGFQQGDFDRPTIEFSGGWRMRIELAKILLQKPDALLLDEPTNHLDIESIMWLEQWLKNCSGAVVLVSHDRTFLDAATNRTIEIATGKIYDYKAAYSKYVQLRQERQLNQEQAKKNQDKYIKHTKELINKFRYKKSKAAFAQSLIKKLDKLERVEVDAMGGAVMRFRFPPAPHSGKISIKAKHIFKSYGALEVLNDISLEVEKGEKIAFVGKNGEGKTTLAKIIVNQLEYEGSFELGYQVNVGYYAQNQSDLLEDNLTVLQTIENAVSGDTNTNVRKLLGSFLFSGDSVEKKIKVLSGGERAKVALCKLLLKPVSLLVMDEPTNHLDMSSKDILKQALANYDGTLIIVSHDRDFLQDLTNKVYEFKNQTIKEHIGDVTAFLKARNVEDLKQLEMKLVATGNGKAKAENSSDNKNIYKEKKQLQRDFRKASNRSGKLEREIEELEKYIKDLDTQLADSNRYRELTNQKGFFEEYQQKQDELKQLMKEWEAVQQKLTLMEKG